MIPTSISLSFGGSLILLILLVIIAVGCAILFYRYTLPPLPARLRVILSILRSLSLVLILLILFEPILRLVRKDEQPPTVAVLIDNTQSMTIKDGSGDRAAIMKQLLQKKQLGNLPSNVKAKFFAFSSKIQSVPGGSIAFLPFNGETTDLSTILAELKEQLQRENIQAITLVTDGNYTTGRNPIYEAELLGIPLYTVGIGDTNEQKDILVEKLMTNNIAYAETRVPVDATIKSSGYSGENVEVTLADGSTIIDRKVLTLQTGTHEYPVKLFVEPKEEGTKKYIVSVSKLPGELTEKNNAHPFFMKILRSKLRVLLLAGAPNPDVPAVRQALAEDEHLTVRSLVQKNASEFYEGRFNITAVDSADCIVLVGFPSSATDGAIIKQTWDVVDRKKKPILFINNKIISYTKLQTFEPILPFTWLNANTEEFLVFPSITERQKNHPLITLEGNITAEGWQQLPPIYKTQTIFHAKPESDVLAAVKLQNIVLAEPLVATRNINRQKSFAITGHGVWRWRLLAQGNSETEKFFPLLMSNAVRWLTTKEEDKNVRITPVKETFTTAEPVEFTGQVYDDQLKPVSDAEVIVEISKGKENFHIALSSVGSGLYEGSLDGIGEGDYTFSAKATTDGRLLGEDKGRFSVGQMNVEFLETKMNKPLLEQLAYRTGGRYYNVEEAGKIANDLNKDVKFSPKEIIQTNEIELWNWRYLAAAIILLLGIEWFMRKRSGML